jgi:transposase
MGYIEGHSRDQMLLLPASVDDYVAADNPVRFIAAFVDDLDLGELGFGRSRPKATGRPGYDPADLLKLYLYGYLNRVRSSRCLAAETARNLEVIWLLGGLRPDFRTIADFRRANRASFKPLFRSFVLLCRRLDLFGRELVAVDGTRLKAVNSRKRNFTRQKLAGWIKQADERVGEYLARLDRADHAEAEAEGAARRAAVLTAKIARMRERRERHSAMLADLVASGESQMSLTDPDARGMATQPKVGVGYNAQVAVDARHKLIVEQYVTNSGSDLGFLAQTASAAREVLGVEQIDAVADKGYYKGGHRRLRGSRRHGLCRATTARSGHYRGIFRQGRVPLRYPQGLLHLPRRPASRSVYSLPEERACHDPLCQYAGLPGLRAQTAMRVRHAAEHRSVGE